MLLDALPFVILTFHLLDKACLAVGKLFPVYCLTILGSTATIIYNLLLWVDMKGGHTSILLFGISSAWSISMAIAGLWRLFKESKVIKSIATHNIASVLSK